MRITKTYILIFTLLSLNSFFSGLKWAILTSWGCFRISSSSSFKCDHSQVCRMRAYVTGVVWTKVRLILADTVLWAFLRSKITCLGIIICVKQSRALPFCILTNILYISYTQGARAKTFIKQFMLGFWQCSQLRMSLIDLRELSVKSNKSGFWRKHT